MSTNRQYSLFRTIIYSKKLTVAGQVDCIAEYNGKLSVIDFKTANKERNDEWNKNYYIQCTAAYAIMYEEIFGAPIEQIVILQAGEDGSGRVFVKEQSRLLEEKLLARRLKVFINIMKRRQKTKKS